MTIERGISIADNINTVMGSQAYQEWSDWLTGLLNIQELTIQIKYDTLKGQLDLGVSHYEEQFASGRINAETLVGYNGTRISLRIDRRYDEIKRATAGAAMVSTFNILTSLYGCNQEDIDPENLIDSLKVSFTQIKEDLLAE